MNMFEFYHIDPHCCRKLVKPTIQSVRVHNLKQFTTVKKW